MIIPDRNAERNSRGFTVVELVVVIVIIGILAATALPRFVDLTDDAHKANVEAMSSSFRSGVDLVHASWIARGATAKLNSLTVEGGGSIGVNDSGWPENTLVAGGDGTATTTECVALWSGLLNSAPTVSATAGAAAWLTSVQGANICRYTGTTAEGRYFDYDTSTGMITTSTDVASSSSSAAASPSSASGGGTTCGLVGIEPIFVLVLVRFRRGRALKGGVGRRDSPPSMPTRSR